MAEDVRVDGSRAELTVVIPAYNGSTSVLASVASVLDQSDERVRVVLVDDGSTDDTPEVLATITDPRVHFLAAKHGGPCHARNLGAEVVTTPWLAFLDSDDLALPGWCDCILDRALGDECVALVSWRVSLRYPDNSVRIVEPTAMGPAFGDVTALFLAGSFAVRTDLFRAVGGYRPGLRYGENTELGMRLGIGLRRAGLTTIAADDVLLAVAARHRSYDAQRYYEAGEQTLREALPQLQRDSRLLGDYLAITGVAASRLGRRRRAIALLWRAWKVEPLRWRHPLRLLRAAIGVGRWK